METLPLNTAILALVASTLLTLIRMAFGRMKTWHPLLVQGSVVVIGIALAAAFNYFDFNKIPEIYQTPFFTVLQGIVGGLTAVGMNNVKDGAVYGKAGAISDERKLANTDIYEVRKNPGAEE